MLSTCEQGIKLQGQDKLILRAYSDFNWGSCVDTRKSIAGYVMMLRNSLISWKGMKQQIVSKSSSKAEYRAMESTISELTWLIRLLQELHVQISMSVTLFCDNQLAIFIDKNPIFHEN